MTRQSDDGVFDDAIDDGDDDLYDDDGDVEVEVDVAWEEPHRRRRWPLAVLSLLVAGLLAAGMAALWFQRQVDPPGDPGADVQVAIPFGSSPKRIGAILDDKGVITSARAFDAYIRLKGAGGFQAGEYTFRSGESFDDVIAALKKGPDLTFQRLTIPEGYRLDQIAERVGTLPGRSADKFLELAKSGRFRSELMPPDISNLEGMLYPDTYFLEEDDDEAAILQRMITAMEDAARAAGVDRAQELVGRTPYEAVIVASLVEREARVGEERPKISRVIHNRLEKGQLLQVDATVLYAIGHKSRVLFKDLEVDSPYNTYRYKGLPPTPIAAPGKAVLEAAVNPEPGPWLYYVVIDKDGRHAFATTNAEHEANIRKAKQAGARK